MTSNERKILTLLARGKKWGGWLSGWLGPSRIALGLGKSGGSSWACRYLRGLRMRGLVRREPPGLYAITKQGFAELELYL